jgi:hypothetical protein
VVTVGAGEVPHQVRLRAGSQLLELPEMPTRHRKDQVGVGDHLPRHHPGAVSRQVESLLQRDEVGALGRGLPAEGPRPRGAHLDPLEPHVSHGTPERHLGEG